MVSKNDLFLAVLAMDAYNSGENPTLKIDPLTAAGTATIKLAFSVQLTALAQDDFAFFA
jgi:hypothetical protein